MPDRIRFPTTLYCLHCMHRCSLPVSSNVRFDWIVKPSVLKTKICASEQRQKQKDVSWFSCWNEVNSCFWYAVVCLEDLSCAYGPKEIKKNHSKQYKQEQTCVFSIPPLTMNTWVIIKALISFSCRHVCNYNLGYFPAYCWLPVSLMGLQLLMSACGDQSPEWTCRF